MIRRLRCAGGPWHAKPTSFDPIEQVGRSSTLWARPRAIPELARRLSQIMDLAVSLIAITMDEPASQAGVNVAMIVDGIDLMERRRQIDTEREAARPAEREVAALTMDLVRARRRSCPPSGHRRNGWGVVRASPPVARRLSSRWADGQYSQLSKASKSQRNTVVSLSPFDNRPPGHTWH